VRYACIARHVGEYPLRLLRAGVDVSPAGYYAWRTRTTPSQRARADEILMARVRVSFRRSKGTYGAPRVHGDLRAAGVRVAKKRVARLIRQDGLVARRRRRRVRTTDSAHAQPIAPNHLDRRFDVNGVAINRVWVSDITYIPTAEGVLFLAVVLDLASRRVVGWSMQATLAADLALAALRMAIARRGPAPGLLHHADRGVQYACADFQRLLAAHRMQPSMSKKGDCWDNAVAESFFSTLELELIDGARWQTRDQARQAIFEFIETWYNLERRHSTLGYRSPAVYEKEVLRDAA
jgi:transposase InsO family protein